MNNDAAGGVVQKTSDIYPRGSVHVQSSERKRGAEKNINDGGADLKRSQMA